MTPQFREAVFNLPLCKESITEELSFGKNKRAQKMLFEIQKMLVMLQTADTRAWSTQDLTKSFGWSDNNGREQQDIHELNRVLVDAIEQALSGTPYESLIRELYFGELTSVIMCLECGNARKRPEPLLDLMLTVKGFKNVQESMNDLFSFQTFDGDDKLTCDYCGVKTASQKGQNLTKLAPVLTLTLNRIEMDYQTWQRKKINDRFEFPLELDVSPYLEQPQGDAAIYELKAIVIHRGGPYGGHYYAYMKDDLGQGVWDKKIPETWQAQPTPKTPVVEPAKTQEPTFQEEKKGKKKQKKQQQPKKEKQPEVELDFDQCDFPVAYSKASLVQNWFEFNDSTVSPIMPGALQSTFGGHSGSAYMLIYRQRNLELHETNIPKYWLKEIEQQNRLLEQERQRYNELKNQLDIIVQDGVLFNECEGGFIKYVQDADFEQQGVKIRLRFTDTISEMREAVSKTVGLQTFDLIEVQRVQNGFCQLLNPVSQMDMQMAVKDSPVSHLSCWMLVTDSRLIQYTRDDALPVQLRVRCEATEKVISLYNNTPIAVLVQQLSQLSGLALSEIKVKMVEETRITRIDTQQGKTLKEAKVAHNAAILVERKDTDEMEETASYTPDVLNIDDTEDFRTVIVNTEQDKDSHQRLQFNLSWTLTQLVAFLKDELKLEGADYRLRNLFNNKLYVIEEMQTKLRTYDTFVEGGVRIQIEEGRPTTMSEICVTVFELGKDHKKQFYFNSQETIESCKAQMVNEMGLEDQYTLYRTDAFEEPKIALRRGKQTFGQAHVTSGDLLCLKSDKLMLPGEKLKIALHCTSTGLSEDSQYMKDIEVSKEITLSELKEIIIDCLDLQLQDPDCLRLREKNNNMFFGKIFRENKTLKQLQVKDRSPMVYQVLGQPEVLTDPNMYVLLMSWRDTEQRVYKNTVEVKFSGRSLEDLFTYVESHSAQKQFRLAKHVPHEFEWKAIDPDMECVEKKKNKERKFKLRDIQDLKHYPLMLRDGDHLAICYEETDDLQTEMDTILRKEFQLRKENERKQRDLDQAGKKRANDNSSVVINLQDD